MRSFAVGIRARSTRPTGARHGFPQVLFRPAARGISIQTSIIAPHVRRLGADVAVVSYVRLIQHVDAHNQPQTACFEETRVWQRTTANGGMSTFIAPAINT